ncbi:TolC family protein [Sphingomonas psychrotolerans]|uniref:Transporter n=1 Tax=Sphingomonas psychrotolerans TaxID=1327635 RepID=A0A2K8MB98_9SPHN|nr:TolC family protein [Sphingomonas psychrotolerans]ATY31133.1 hypothetical protein CVN68_03320 [Sphingomonas psychrotolerans]
MDAASAGVRAADAQRRAAALRPNPSINVEAENVIGNGAYSGLSSAETTVGMSLPLELGGKGAARVRVAEAQADLRLKVTRAFNDSAAAERRLVIVRE